MVSENVRTLYSRVETLKILLGDNKNKNLYSDGELWTTRQELQSLFKKILLTDLEYALDKKVDLDLWNYGFKDYIGFMQSQKETSKSGLKKEQNVEAQVTLTWFLEMASGFYLMLLEELRSTYDLDYSFLRKGEFYGCGTKKPKDQDDNANSSVARKNNCVYICQHCLVHLGDLARYRNQIGQAETFYRQAIRLSPSSGQAYNQIALLEANRGNKLTSVFYYVRSLSVKYPFPFASSNLVKILGRFFNDLPSKVVNVTTFVHQFLRLEGSLRLAVKLKSSAKICKELNESLTSLIATESLRTWHLIQITVIHIHQIGNIDLSTDVSEDESFIRDVACEFMAGLLNALSLPVYTLKGDSLIKYFALPCVKLILNWISVRPEILEQKRFKLKKQIWPSICRLLNELAEGGLKDDSDDYPLPEDYDLQGFLPLQSYLTKYDYRKPKNLKGYLRRDDDNYDDDDQNDQFILSLRARRLVDVGRVLSEQKNRVIRYEDGSFKPVEYRVETDEEFERIMILGGDEDEDENRPEIIDMDDCEKTLGILKIKPEDLPIVPSRKKRTNVAMEAILMKNSIDKQVTFRTPSPASSPALSGSQGSTASSDSAFGNPPARFLPIPPPDFSVPPPNDARTMPSFAGPVRPHDHSSSLFAAPTNYNQSYSLFSASPWAGRFNFPRLTHAQQQRQQQLPYHVQQSQRFQHEQGFNLFQSGGPSPLEKLIRQQKK